MKKQIVRSVLAIIAVAAVLLLGAASRESAPMGSAAAAAQMPAVGYANPAATYCAGLGYQYEIQHRSDGDAGTCKLPGGLVCDEWEFLAGKCGAEYSICSREGYGLETRADGDSPFAREYAVCVENGKTVATVAQLADLEEKATHSGCSQPAPVTVEPQQGAAPEQGGVEALPASFDWRSRPLGSYLTNIKNQGQCGSCWAFSAVGAAEAALNIASSKVGDNYDLAEEYLVSSCFSGGTCCGGSPSGALDQMRATGIPDEACLPYVDGDWDNGCGCDSGGCSANCTYRTGGQCSDRTCANRCSNYATRLVKMAATGGMAPARDTIKSNLISKGPLSVSMAMGGTFNSSGVYKCPAGAPVNHAVVIVGYNDAGQFWMVRNSWGATWDGDGYFKVGYGQCQIENYVYYVTAANPQVPTPLAPNGVTLDTTPTYKWMPVSEATQYQYALMKGPAAVYAMTVPASVCGTTCASTPSTVLTAGTYAWRVRAMVGGVWKPFSGYKSFTLGSGFISNFTSDANGWASVYGPWSLARSNFYQSPGVVYAFSSTRHTGSYGNFLYEARVKRTSSQPYWANNIIVRGSPSGLGSLKLWSTGYIFEYANNGAFAVFRVNGASVTALKQWTESPAIAQGDWNVLRVAASGSTLKFYINDTLVWRGTDSTLATGQVGIMMYRDSMSTGNRLYVDWARLAMTGTGSPVEEPLAPGVELPGGDLTQAPH